MSIPIWVPRFGRCWTNLTKRFSVSCENRDQRDQGVGREAIEELVDLFEGFGAAGTNGLVET